MKILYKCVKLLQKNPPDKNNEKNDDIPDPIAP